MKLDPGRINKESPPPPTSKPSSSKTKGSVSTSGSPTSTKKSGEGISEPSKTSKKTKTVTVDSANDARRRFRADTNVDLMRAKINDRLPIKNQRDLTPGPGQLTAPEPVHGTGTGTVGNNTNVRVDPSTSSDAQDQISGEVTITGQTTTPDNNNEVWFQVEYEVDGETRTGWIRDDVVDEQIDWREGDAIQLFDADGEVLSDADAENYETAAAAQQELLEDYGIEVAMPLATPGNREQTQFRPLTPDDAEAMTATLEQVRALESEDGYNIDLITAGTAGNTIAWTPGEIDVVYSAVSSAGQAAFDQAQAQGYDVESPEQVFRDLYGPMNIERVNRPTIDNPSTEMVTERFY
ncbi:MAG: SH3 domain-containing protein, partial [Myxococcota bacterium]